MKQVHGIPNYRQIKTKFLGPTETRGARIVIWEDKRYNDDKKRVVTLPYDYEISNVEEQAYQYLIGKGFDIVARASEQNNYVLLANNWGNKFIELK